MDIMMNIDDKIIKVRASRLEFINLLHMVNKTDIGSDLLDIEPEEASEIGNILARSLHESCPIPEVKEMIQPGRFVIGFNIENNMIVITLDFGRDSLDENPSLESSKAPKDANCFLFPNLYDVVAMVPYVQNGSIFKQNGQYYIITEDKPLILYDFGYPQTGIVPAPGEKLCDIVKGELKNGRKTA